MFDVVRHDDAPIVKTNFLEVQEEYESYDTKDKALAFRAIEEFSPG